jgi:tRNA modification GTPase
LDGLAVRLADTAGLRETPDRLESAGMDKSRELMAHADLVLLVHDGSVPVDEAELAQAGHERVLGVVNKADLDRADPDPEGIFQEAGREVVSISAKTGLGLDALTAAVRQRLIGESGEADHGEAVPNLRQAEALRRADSELAALGLDIQAGLPYDLLGVRLEAAGTILAEITGQLASDEVLAAVFDTFCIGK